LEKIPKDEVRRFILTKLEGHPEDVARVAAEHFGITRQAVHRHLDSLLKDGLIEASGRTRRKRYTLKCEFAKEVLSLKDNRDEDRVWRTLVEPHLMGLTENVLRICQYGFTEIFNNAIDHSEGSVIRRPPRKSSVLSCCSCRRSTLRIPRFWDRCGGSRQAAVIWG
jgi:DNA-binding transcriptional ArsR family regulator